MNRIFKSPLTWVFIIAMGVRFYLSVFTAVVNPDGLIYIQQARAIYFQQWSAINACGMKYLSILPPLIAGAFAVFHDWVVAGRFIGLLFSCGMFVPLYFILKRFFDARITRLTLLVYAFIPALAGRSAEVIRGPVFWFFLLTALWMVLRHHDTGDANRSERNNGRKGLNLILACLCLMVAAWARIESILYLCITAGYLFYREKGRRIQSLTIFLLPLIVMAAMGIVAALALDLPLTRLFRLDKPVEVLAHFMDDYHGLRASLDSLANSQHGLVAEFLNQAGKFAWIVPLGPFLDCLAEKFFYPYLLIFLLGFAGLRQRMKTDPRIAYFVWLCLGRR
ncbi:glycosyltransferase family 39 protein [Desulfosarcina cetonica]|uniref:glycosyltransferase family 39 protein n=1 Tax=Desulfosarcina cetonica TaxID=90730 RepID=UPI0006D06390|nr:glycosyltransferase family 39 protein [Desulfosarcina cetonica]